MRRTLRTFAAAVAGLALVAALPAPCGCAPQRAASGDTSEHACCKPPAGVSAADGGCCDAAPELAEALASPTIPAQTASAAFVTLSFAAVSGHPAFARPSTPLVSTPPPPVLRT